MIYCRNFRHAESARARELCRRLAGASVPGRVRQGHVWVANSLTAQPVTGIWLEKGCSGGATKEGGGAYTANVAESTR